MTTTRKYFRIEFYVEGEKRWVATSSNPMCDPGADELAVWKAYFLYLQACSPTHVYRLVEVTVSQSEETIHV